MARGNRMSGIILLGSDSVWRHGPLTSPWIRIEVLACTHAASGYVTQARAHSGPVQDISGGIEIPIDRKPAARAVVAPIGEVFRDLRAAAGAFLAGISGIHFDQARTGSFSLIAQ